MPKGGIFPPLGMSVDSVDSLSIPSILYVGRARVYNPTFYTTVHDRTLHYTTLDYMPKGGIFLPLGMSVDSISTPRHVGRFCRFNRLDRSYTSAGSGYIINFLHHPSACRSILSILSLFCLCRCQCVCKISMYIYIYIHIHTYIYYIYIWKLSRVDLGIVQNRFKVI